MIQIITGPFGRIAYHDATRALRGQYPALNLPCRAFARGDALVAANAQDTPDVIYLSCRGRSGARADLPGTSGMREN
jgi:hypothetical protein